MSQPRYLIFGGEKYYPRAGGNDYLFSHKHLDTAKKHCNLLLGSKFTYTETTSDFGYEDFVAENGGIEVTIDFVHVFSMDELKVVFSLEK